MLKAESDPKILAEIRKVAKVAFPAGNIHLTLNSKNSLDEPA